MSEHDPLERAAELARREPGTPPDWEATRDSVLRRVRATVRPGRPVSAPVPDAHDSLTWVNERAVVASLRRRIASLEGLAPSSIRLTLDDGVCTALDVEVVARYGTEIPAIGRQVRDACRDVLAELLLEPAEVRVTAVDVTLDVPDL